MIERMKYFSMVGPISDIDLAVGKYLNGYDIHFENAFNRMSHNDGIQPFTEKNPYADALAKAAKLMPRVRAQATHAMQGGEAVRLIDDVYREHERREDERKELLNRRDAIVQYMAQFRGFEKLPVELDALDRFEYIAYEFGRFTRQQFTKFETMMGRHLNSEDTDYSEETKLTAQRDAAAAYIETLEKFENLPLNLEELNKLVHFEHVFGRLPINNLNQFASFCVNDREVVFQECTRDGEYVWGFYVTPVAARDTVESVFSSLYFERIPLTNVFMDETTPGTPRQIIAYWNQRILNLNRQIIAARQNAQAEKNARHETNFDDTEILFFQGGEDDNYIYGCYFVPVSVRSKVSAIFRSLRFERIPLSYAFIGETVAGTPADIIAFWYGRLKQLNTDIAKIEPSEHKEELNWHTQAKPAGEEREKLAAACAKVAELHEIFEIKRYAAVINGHTYTFIGWMREEDAASLAANTVGSGASVYLRDNRAEPIAGEEPPVVLKNLPVIRYFEFFTKMYGVPSYGEADPTPVMAIVYSILYGLMFGDVGQGLCISLLGTLLYRFKKMALGGVMIVLGISASLFGFLYGSVFGLEELIPALWHHPQADIMGTLLTAVAVGVCVVLTAMIFNIINSFRRKDWGEMLFSPNGAAGVLFYGMVLLTAARVMLLGQRVGVISVVLIVLPLILVALKEPLEKRLRGEHVKPEGGVVMYGLGLVLELVEVLLSYATNTISFIRVGAFAISHAGMMAVVLMLAKTANDTHNPLVMIIGNILVIGIEGFLVGIQVLRLDFYELFSRFYRGGGQPFTPYRQKAIHK